MEFSEVYTNAELQAEELSKPNPEPKKLISDDAYAIGLMIGELIKTLEAISRRLQ